MTRLCFVVVVAGIVLAPGVAQADADTGGPVEVVVPSVCDVISCVFLPIAATEDVPPVDEDDPIAEGGPVGPPVPLPDPPCHRVALYLPILGNGQASP